MSYDSDSELKNYNRSPQVILTEKLDSSRPDQALYLDSGLSNLLPFSLDSFPDNIPHCQMDTLSECLRKRTSKEGIYEIKSLSGTPLSGMCIYVSINSHPVASMQNYS